MNVWLFFVAITEVGFDWKLTNQKRDEKAWRHLISSFCKAVLRFPQVNPTKNPSSLLRCGNVLRLRQYRNQLLRFRRHRDFASNDLGSGYFLSVKILIGVAVGPQSCA